MKSTIPLLRLLLVIAAVSTAVSSEPRRAHGQDPLEDPAVEFDGDYLGLVDRMHEHAHELQREQEETYHNFESTRAREVEANTGGRHLCDVTFLKRGSALVFGGDGKQLFCCLEDGTVRVINIESGEQTSALRLAECEVSTLALSPDGRRLIAGCEWENRVRTWDLTTGKMIAATKLTRPWQVIRMALSANGKYVAVSGDTSETYEYTGYLGRRFVERYSDPHIYIYDTLTGKLLRTINSGSSQPLVMSPVGTSLLSDGHQWWRWPGKADPFDPVILAQAGFGSRGSYSPDGTLVATIVKTVDQLLKYCLALRVFDASTGNLKGEYYLAQANPNPSIPLNDIFNNAPAISPSGNSVAYCVDEPKGKERDQAAEMFRYDPSSGSLPAPRYKTTYGPRTCVIHVKSSRKLYLPKGDEWVHSLCYSPNGRHLAAILGPYPGNMNLTVRIWEVPSDGASSVQRSTTDDARSTSPSPFGSSEPVDDAASGSSFGRPFHPTLPVASILVCLVIGAYVAARQMRRKQLSQLPTGAASPRSAATPPLPHQAPIDDLQGKWTVEEIPFVGSRNVSCGEDAKIPATTSKSCPACGKILRVPRGIRPNAKVSCRICKRVFRIRKTTSISQPSKVHIHSRSANEADRVDDGSRASAKPV